MTACIALPRDTATNTVKNHKAVIMDGVAGMTYLINLIQNVNHSKKTAVTKHTGILFSDTWLALTLIRNAMEYRISLLTQQSQYN